MWRKLPHNGNAFPSARNCHSMDIIGDNIVVFGGLGSSAKERFNDLWVYNMNDKAWIQTECHGDVPTPRYCCSLNSVNEKLVCFGGFGDGDRLNSVHYVHVEHGDWKFLITNGELPEKRSHHTGTIAGQRLIVFGGLSQEGRRLNDLHVLDLSTLTWSRPELHGTLPSPRLGHTCVVLNSTVLVVFGGYGGPDEGHTKYNELNLLHFETMTWSQPTVSGPIPPPMYAHRAVAIGDKMIVFGGDVGTGSRSLSADVWIFDLSSMRWSKVNAFGDIPPARSHFSASLHQNQLIIFGGSGKGESEKLNDIYALDLGQIEILREIPFDSLKEHVDDTCSFIQKEMQILFNTVEQTTGISSKEIRQAKKIMDGKLASSLSSIKTQYEKLVKEKELFASWREDQLETIEVRQSQYLGQRQYLNEIVQSKTGRVILNVGGQKFDTSLATLTKDATCLLTAMFSGRFPIEAAEDGSYFIDRDGTHFRYCLNYLRDNTVSLPPNRSLHLELLREASYYQISGLVEQLRAGLRKLDVALDPYGAEAEKERMKGKSKI